MKLTAMGYHFEVTGERLRWRFEGQGQPDSSQVRPLLQLVKAHKDEVLFFLRCDCPRCGGMMFIPDPEGRDLCASCDWHLLTEVYPGLKERLKDCGVSEHKKAPEFVTRDLLDREDIRPRNKKLSSADRQK